MNDSINHTFLIGSDENANGFGEIHFTGDHTVVHTGFNYDPGTAVAYATCASDEDNVYGIEDQKIGQLFSKAMDGCTRIDDGTTQYVYNLNSSTVCTLSQMLDEVVEFTPAQKIMILTAGIMQLNGYSCAICISATTSISFIDFLSKNNYQTCRVS